MCFLPGLCADVSDIPQPTALWLFTELRTHCELSHYLFLPDLLWTDFSWERAPETYKSQKGTGGRVQIICLRDSSAGAWGNEVWEEDDSNSSLFSERDQLFRKLLRLF